ncbi:MAG: nuclear transport factor 2 family protein [Runella sp.]
MINKVSLIFLVLLAPYFFGKIKAQTAIQKEVLEFEQKRIDATLHSDVSALQEMLAEDLVWVHSSGKKQNKAQYIDDHAQKRVKYLSIKLEESEARVYGNIAVTNGRAVYESISQKDGSTIVNNLFHTCVYRKSKGRWQVIAWQTTKVPD